MALAYPEGRFITYTSSMTENARMAWSIENPLGELFTPEQLTVLGVAVGALSQRDFTPSESERNLGLGTHLGLTNERVAAVRDTILRGSTATLPEGGLYVLETALLELTMPHFGLNHAVDLTDPKVRVKVDQLRGRVLQLAGFHNEAVGELTRREASHFQ